MKVLSLKLENYRGFRDVEIDFSMKDEHGKDIANNLIVIAGINGLGKSSILHSLRILMSRSIPNIIGIPFQEIDFEDENIREGQSYSAASAIIDYGADKIEISYRKSHSQESVNKQHDLSVLRANLEFFETRSRLILIDDSEVSKAVNIAVYLEHELHIARNEKGISDANEAYQIFNKVLNDNLLTDRISAIRAYIYKDLVSRISRIDVERGKSSNYDLEHLGDEIASLKYYLSPEDGEAGVIEITRRIEVLKIRINELVHEIRKGEFRMTDLLSKESWSLKKRRPINVPLVVYYSASRQIARNLRVQSKSQSRGIRNAYELALLDRPVNSEELESWIRSELYLNRANIIEKIMEPIKMLTGIDRIDLSDNGRSEVVLWKNGVPLSLAQMSDGEQLLIALTFDLARRLVLANPRLTNPTENGQGIVLVDEIELHLHPAWQRKVIACLTQLFPNCQFILTSHSPQIIGEVRKDSVILLSRHEGEVYVGKPIQAFGLDSNRILEELMNVPQRNTVILSDLRQLHHLIDSNDFNAAQMLINEIRNDISGDDPVLIEAESTMDFLEGEHEEH